MYRIRVHGSGLILEINRKTIPTEYSVTKSVRIGGKQVIFKGKGTSPKQALKDLKKNPDYKACTKGVT